MFCVAAERLGVSALVLGVPGWIQASLPWRVQPGGSAVKMPASLLAMHRKRTARKLKLSDRSQISMRAVPVSTGPADMPALLVGRSSIAMIQRKIGQDKGRFAQ